MTAQPLALLLVVVLFGTAKADRGVPARPPDRLENFLPCHARRL